VSEVKVMGLRRMKSTARGASVRKVTVKRTADKFGQQRFLHSSAWSSSTMHLMYTLNENGERVYTLKVPTECPFLLLRSSPFCARK